MDPNQTPPENTSFTPLTPSPVENKTSKKRVFIIIFAACIVALVLLFIFYNKFSSNSSFKSNVNTTETPQQKNIIVIQSELKKGLLNTNLIDKIVSFNPNTKEKKLLMSVPQGSSIEEARTSPDGKKLYFTMSTFPQFPYKIALLKSDGSKKEYELLNSNLWTLSSPGNLHYPGEKDCYWSPDSILLACHLIERENVGGAGTGRMKIVVLNVETEQVHDVFDNETLEAIKPAVIGVHFSGWINNSSILLTKKAFDDLATPDTSPSEFYIYDIKNKNVTQKFTYLYESSPHTNIAIYPDKKLFFTSTSRTTDIKFVEYDLTLQKATEIKSDGTFIAPTMSEDGKTLLYVTGALDRKYVIHSLDLENAQEETIDSPIQVFNVDAQLLNNEDLILRSTPDKSFYFNKTSREQLDLEGVYVGSGYF